MLERGKRLAVFSIRQKDNAKFWVRAGSAHVNKDGSLNIYLDVLPLDGALHVREALEKKDALAPASSATQGTLDSALEATGMEAH